MTRARAAAALVLSASAVACEQLPQPTPPPPPPVSTPDGWVALPGSPLSPEPWRHDDIFFLDEANGWLSNERRELYRTQDAGTTWELLARFTEVIPRCLGFASLTKGWVGNINYDDDPTASLYETEDGGRTWSNISARIQGDPVPGLCGMRVLGSNTIVAVGRTDGPAVFVKTTDGGRIWKSRSLAPLATGLVDVFFFNERSGFAVGRIGGGPLVNERQEARSVILATADGGETWRTRYTSAGTNQWAWKIHFADARTGYVTTEGLDPHGEVVKTTDGGATWRPIVVTPRTSFEGVAFVTPDRGWVGSGSTLFSTSDGGATWKPLLFGERINRMRVLRSDLVYACGDRVYKWTP